MVIRWEEAGPGTLRACGIDAEQVGRFAKLVGTEHPWPQVFSAREAAHVARSDDPAATLCASFCCKEALVKALEASFPFRECELLLDPGREDQELLLSAGLRGSHRISAARARIFSAREGELAAVVRLYGEIDG